MSFRYYLYSTYFEVYTDSKSVAQLALGKKNIQSNGVLLRLFEKIMHFDFKIIHVKANTGGSIQVADALSRLRIEKDIEEHPDTVRPIAYPSKYLERMPQVGDEQVLVLNNAEDACYYNLRKDIRKPQRYGEQVDQDEDQESESDESDVEINELEASNENEVGSVKGKDKEQEQTEIEKLVESTDIPKYMIQPRGKLFEGAKVENVILKNFPRQLDMNKFINSVLACCNTFGVAPLRRHEIICAQKQAVLYRDVIRFLKFDQLPANRELVKQVLAMSQEFSLVDEILCHVSFDNKTGKLRVRPVIPDNQLALRLIDQSHSSALLNHIAVNSTYNILNAKYYIKNLLELTRRYVKACVQCRWGKEAEKPASGYDYKYNLTKSTHCFQIVHIDIKKMYKSENSEYLYLLICVDNKSKFMLTEALKNRSTNEIIRALLRIQSIVGLFSKIITDLESSITSTICQAFLQFLNIKIEFCLPDNHILNSVAERGISKLISRLIHLLGQKEEYWNELAQIACLSANSLIQKNGYSAYEILFGREPRSPIDIANADIDFTIPTNENEYVHNIKQSFKLADQVCRQSEKILQANLIAKHRSEVKKLKCLEVFDLCYVLSPSSKCYVSTHSLKINYRHVGPLCVQQVRRERAYRLRTLDNVELTQEYHLNRLERAHLLIGDKNVDNLISLIAEIKLHGQKNREEVLAKLQETEKSILQANNMEEPKVSQNDDSQPVDSENICVVGEINDTKVAEITKKRWKHGQLQILIKLDGDKMQTWHSIDMFPSEVINEIMASKVRTVGSLNKYRKRLGLKTE